MKGKRSISGRWLGLIVLSIFNFQFSITSAQELLNYPLDTINGEEVYRYQVEKSIGIYRIGVNFNVPQSEIIRLNPQLRERGLHYGETLLLPTGRKVEKFKKITPKETEIPQSRDLSISKDTVIPQSRDTVIPKDTVISSLPDTLIQEHRHTVDLALMLPFESKQIKRSTNAERMMEFYQGALLALHDLRNDSTLYRLHVYDTERSEKKVKELCDNTELDSIDGILGLVYPIQIERMSEWSDVHNVPLLLPFSDDLELGNHPQVLQFNSSDLQEADSLCRWIKAHEDSVHCIVVDVREADITPSIRTLRKQLQANGIQYSGLALRDLMTDSAAYALDATKENLFILHSDRYQHARIILPQIKKIQDAGFRVRIVSQYSWQKENIDLHQIYTSMFNLAADQEAYDALWRESYVNEHVSEVPRYDLLGYDLMKTLVGWLHGEKTHSGLQSEIRWIQVNEGGYQNAHVRVIEK